MQLWYVECGTWEESVDESGEENGQRFRGVKLVHLSRRRSRRPIKVGRLTDAPIACMHSNECCYAATRVVCSNPVLAIAINGKVIK